jgi:hypothetical protein
MDRHSARLSTRRQRRGGKTFDFFAAPALDLAGPSFEAARERRLQEARRARRWPNRTADLAAQRDNET